MSTNLAFALPERSHRPESSPREADRHIEVVSSRRQRLARPRLAYSLLIIAGLFAVLITQLLLSIALADGAYQISALQSEQKEINRERQSVTEDLNVLGSPQNLAARAESLGMVSNPGTAYLNLADGAVSGAPVAASASAPSVIGANGSLLIANSLLAGVPGTMDSPTPAITGAPEPGATPDSVASTSTALPGPVTR